MSGIGPRGVALTTFCPQGRATRLSLIAKLQVYFLQLMPSLVPDTTPIRMHAGQVVLGHRRARHDYPEAS